MSLHTQVATMRLLLPCCVIVSTVFKFEVSASSNVEDEVIPNKKLTFPKGHLRPFGESGPKLQIEESTEFPEPVDFLLKHVSRSKPLKLSGVTRNSRAVRLWTDDYLLALDVPADSVVQLETEKKENRLQPTEEMHFHQFLNIYNQSQYYMVDDVPAFLRPDVMVPCSLQCAELMEKGLAYALMWFSSGGTKSVVHTDAYDNINCVIRGDKTFVLVDPARDRNKIPLHTNGSYSDIDVDSVDLTRHPALTETEFYHVNVTAGDCLYIPYKWIHQVRSYNSNVAVNFWWDHHASLELQQARPVCQEKCDPSLTLDQVETTGVENLMESYESIRDWVLELVMDNPATEQELADIIRDDIPLEADDTARKFFHLLDLNHDGVFTTEEHAEVPIETWQVIQEHIASLIRLMEAGTEEEPEMEGAKDEL